METIPKQHVLHHFHITATGGVHQRDNPASHCVSFSVYIKLRQQQRDENLLCSSSESALASAANCSGVFFCLPTRPAEAGSSMGGPSSTFFLSPYWERKHDKDHHEWSHNSILLQHFVFWNNYLWHQHVSYMCNVKNTREFIQNKSWLRRNGLQLLILIHVTVKKYHYYIILMYVI